MLDPICTSSEAEDFGYTVSDADLARASSRIRSYTGQRVTEGSSTVLLAGRGPWLLPERPVSAVSALVDEDGAAVEFTLRGQMLHAYGCNLTVTFDHGYEQGEVPDTLVEACAQIASRLGSSAGSDPGIQQITQGSISVGFGMASANAASDLMPGEKAMLDRIYPKRPRTVRLH